MRKKGSRRKTSPGDFSELKSRCRAAHFYDPFCEKSCSTIAKLSCVKNILAIFCIPDLATWFTKIKRNGLNVNQDFAKKAWKHVYFYLLTYIQTILLHLFTTIQVAKCSQWTNHLDFFLKMHKLCIVFFLRKLCAK